MRRIALLSVLISLIVSCAVPTGAVFAFEEGNETTTPVAGTNVEGVAEEEAVITPEALATEVAPSTTIESQPLDPPVEAAVRQEPESVAKQTVPKAAEAINLVAEVPVVTPLPPEVEPLVPQRKVYVSAFQKTNALGFIELYNSDSKTISINDWRITAEFGDEQGSCDIQLAGYILPKTKVLLAHEGMSGVSNALRFECGSPQRVLESVSIYDGEQIIERLILPPVEDQIWVRKNTTSTYLTGIFLQDFKADEKLAEKKYVVTDGYWYVPPPAPGIEILEVYVNPRLCVPGDDVAACYDYIKLKNTSNQNVDLGDYRLRSGYSNSTSSSSNTMYSSIVLIPGEVRTLTHDQAGAPISFTANDGTIWFEDVEGMIAYPSIVPPYVGSDLTSNRGRSWAYNEATGRWQWATPSPFAAYNDFSQPNPGRGSASNAPNELVPCSPNQYRSEETNRCRNIASISVLTPCREGQYRSEETNRCRSIATAAASVLKPCADDQFRNPLTNRCKSIASAEDVALADCGEGRERNPETNRCRNLAVVGTLSDTLPFPVEETTTTQHFAGWWTLGIIAALGVGYGIWEWREELVAASRRVTRFIARSK